MNISDAGTVTIGAVTGGNGTVVSIDDVTQSITLNGLNQNFQGTQIAFSVLAGNGNGVVGVDNAGAIFWQANGGNTLYSGNGTLAGNRAVALNGNTLTINQGANALLSIDPTAGAEISSLQAYNTTGGDNQALIFAATTNTLAAFQLGASFNGGAEVAAIDILTNTTDATITYTAEEHIFAGNVGIGATPTSNQLFVVNVGAEFFLEVDPTVNAEQVNIKAVNLTGNDNVSHLQVKTSAADAFFLLQADFNNGVDRAQIEGSADNTISTLTYLADTHTFTGAMTLVDLAGNGVGVVAVDNTGLLSWSAGGSGANAALSNLASVAINTSLISDTDNTDDLGSSSISWKDVYSRTVKLDGSTSGTVTIASDALANVALGTNLSGTGTIPFVHHILVRSDETLANSATDQNLFTNTAHDVITVQANTTYDFTAQFDLTHGAVAHSLAFGLTPTTAVVTNISYMSLSHVQPVGGQTATQTMATIKATATTAVNGSGANAQESVFINGWITIGSTGGTLTPQIKFSVDPTGTVLLKTGSMFKIWAVGNDTFTEKGPIA